MENFAMLQKPTFAPPGFLFPVVWTILYVLMGIASYLVLTSGKPTGNALIVYGIQLVFNFFWSILFFNLGLCMFAFLWLVLLWLLILSDFKTCRIPDDSLSAVGNFCRVLKSWNLSA